MTRLRAWWRRFWDTPTGPFLLRCTDCGEEFITDDHDLAAAFESTHPNRCVSRDVARDAINAALAPAVVSLTCSACGVTASTDSTGQFTHLCNSGAARVTFTVVDPAEVAPQLARPADRPA